MLLLAYKNPCHCWLTRVCCHTLTKPDYLVPLQNSTPHSVQILIPEDFLCPAWDSIISKALTDQDRCKTGELSFSRELSLDIRDFRTSCWLPVLKLAQTSSGKAGWELFHAVGA